MKFLINLFFLFSINLFFMGDCFSNFRKLNPENSIRLIIESNGKEAKACLFEIIPPMQEENETCKALPIPGNWKDCKRLIMEDSFGISPERFATNQMLKVLSEVRLTEKTFKKQLNSTIFFAEDNYDPKNAKKLDEELKKSLQKQGVDSKSWVSKESDSIEFLLNSAPATEEWTILAINDETTQIAFGKSGQSKPQKLLKDSTGFNKYWLEKEGFKENTSCRQAFSPFLRSTGKRGEDNYLECKDFISEKLKGMKIYQDKQVSGASQLVGYGQGFKQVSEYLATTKITKEELEKNAEKACFLSITELMYGKKISKESAKTLCYSVSLVSSILEILGKDEIQTLPNDYLVKTVATSPLLYPECDPRFVPPKK